jgi:TonB-linked SusC/RagA family outer membrane protein
MMQKRKSYRDQFFLPVPGHAPGRWRWCRTLFVLLGIFVFSAAANAQTAGVKGQVTDSSGEALAGVNVVVKGASPMATVTDGKGRYSLPRVPTNAVLLFSFVGFKTQETPLGGRAQVNIRLQEDLATLSEVTVNAGYYTVKDKARTGSITKVTAKEIGNQPVGNVLSAIQGRMAGVNITQNSGVAGGGYNVQIRGINSLRRTGNYPMYVVDGVPISPDLSAALSGGILPNGEISPLNAINPNDIESIEILKDADATAIYGSRGGNGVILVTTKKGKAGNRTSLSVNVNQGFSQVARRMKLMDTEQYVEMRKQAYANDGKTTYPANAYDINGTWDEGRYTDWQEELIGKTARTSTLQFSLAGGNENTGFLLSGNHNEQTSVFGQGFKYKTNNLSGNLHHQSADNKFKMNASGFLSVQTNNMVSEDITSQALRLSPNAPALYQGDGSLNWENNTFTNPAAAYEATYSNDSKALHFNLNLGYDLFPSLSIKLNGGVNYQVFEDIVLRPNTMYNPSYGITSSSSSASKSSNKQYSYLLEPQLNYRRTFGERHQVDILVGSTYQQTNNAIVRLSGVGFESNSLMSNLGAANKVTVAQDVETEYKYAALFGRVNYQLANRYILNLTGRRDGSSRFGTNNRFANFGAVGAAWLFSKENFLKEMPWLSFGKLRASYGITGSDAIGDYQYLDTYTVSSTSYGGSTTLYPSRLYNPYFSWEKTSKLEVAMELGFLNDRIQLNAAWYRNRSGNQLVGIPLPATTGFSSIQANLPATIQNTGLELEFSASPVKAKEFSWNSNFNLSVPRNKLVSFPGLEGSTYANTYVVGYSTAIAKVYNYEGIDPETGLYKFTDYNKDGNITSPDDNKAIRNIGVRFHGGWSNQLSYKRWEFSFLFQFVNQKQWNYKALLANPGTMFNQPVEVLDVWSANNPKGEYMPYSTGADTQKNNLLVYIKNSTSAISDASYIRLKNVQLGYQLPIGKYVRSVRFYAQGQNLLTLTNYFGIDPEVVLAGYLPPLKTYSLGVQFNF